MKDEWGKGIKKCMDLKSVGLYSVLFSLISNP